MYYLNTFKPISLAFLISYTFTLNAQNKIGGIEMGSLTEHLFVFTKAGTDANWQSASKGYIGNVAIKGTVAKERTSGTIAYSGTVISNDNTLDAWQNIIDDNNGQAYRTLNAVNKIDSLEQQLEKAFIQINALSVTSGFSSYSSKDLHGLNKQNSIAEVVVINITSDFTVKDKLEITGDANDVFILRWDTDANFSNGYQGQVKFQSGGAIVPKGGLTPGNFIHVAGDINASGGGNNPPAPYPQGPRYNNGTGSLISGGADFNGGGFFTGYWLTTGSPDNSDGSNVRYGSTASLSNAIFVGGWYSKTDKFSMTSGTSGVYVTTNAALPVTWLEVKAVKSDFGATVSWSTASEENNDHFTVEKSTDNKTFIALARIKGAGNSNSISSYSFSDFNVFGTAYYRIKQTDYDGKFSYSKVVAVNEKNVLNNVKVYPNPCADVLHVNSRENLSVTTVVISDLNGRILKSTEINGQSAETEINVSDLNRGIYVFSVYNNDNTISQQKITVSK